MVKWQTLETTVDYPPAALYELGLVGLAYRRIDPAFADAPALTVAIKLPGLVCGIALTALLAWAAKRFTIARWRRFVGSAGLLAESSDHHQRRSPRLPRSSDDAAGHRGPRAYPLGAVESAGLALALAVLTKPQGIFLVAACALAAWHTGATRALARAAAGGTLGATLLLLPFALTGALPNMWLAFGSFYARRDILSGNAANVWWIVNYAVRAYYQVPRLGPHAFFVEVRRIMAVSTLQEAGFPNPRPFAGAAVLATSAWGLWQLRKAPDLATHALASAFVVHAFFVLGVGVHEHHMMLAVPLLALAASLRPSLRPLFYVVSAIVALNMNLFYGIGMGRGWSVPRLLLGIDLSVLLSVVNIAALVWHGRIVLSEARRIRPTAA